MLRRLAVLERLVAIRRGGRAAKLKARATFVSLLDLRQILAVRQEQLAEKRETQNTRGIATSEPTSRFLRVMPTAALRIHRFANWREPYGSRAQLLRA
jgi:hypothetical protein